MTEFNEKELTSAYMKAGETTLAQYCVAENDTTTDDQVKRPTAAAAGNIIGVLRSSSHVAGKWATYQTDGPAWVRLGGTVTSGDLLIVGDVQGRVIATSGGTVAAGTSIIGRAKQSGVINDIIKVALSIPTEYMT